MKIDWARKLSSRKFWALLSALATAMMILFKINADTMTQITAVIGAFASIIIYILAEASVDGKAVQLENDFIYKEEIK